MYPNGLMQTREDVSTKLFNEGKSPMTQERLAKLCGVTRQTIWSIEDEQSVPSYPLAIKIFDALRRIDPSVQLLKLFPLPPEQKNAYRKALEQSL